MLERLLGHLTRQQAPSREAVVRLIEQHGRRFLGPRRNWQVKAAVWVKKVHIDRGAVAVGTHTTGAGYRIDESLRPQFKVPDLTDFKLRPYVAEVKAGAANAAAAAAPAADTPAAAPAAAGAATAAAAPAASGP